MMLRKAVVLARPVGASALAEVANRPLLDHALRWLAEGGVQDVAILAPEELGREMQVALRSQGGAGPDVSWLVHAPEQTPAALLPALTDFLAGESFVLHHADSLFRGDLASVVGEPPRGERDALIVTGEKVADRPDVVDINSRPGGRGAWPTAGAPSWLAVLGAAVAEATADAGCAAGEALPRWVSEHGGRVTVRRVSECWRCQETGAGLLEGNAFALGNLRTDLSGASLEDTRIEGSVAAEAGTELVSCVVRGPAVIGAGARLRNSYVGPYTSIGRNAFIEGAEIEHSIVLPGAHLSHLGERLEGSIVGRGARVYREFRIPKALRIFIGDGAEVSLS